MEGGYVVVHLHRDNEAFPCEVYSVEEAAILFIAQVRVSHCSRSSRGLRFIHGQGDRLPIVMAFGL
ncbi:hypothetical protein EBBID32_17700 [Sphingobium indicum BiD32]|uniref:Uncharacterized protein n=1 Tax=Sphingobium indicum BiD32 TaxID=1301087 RepID=N1MKE4_9SPHN|nr:hypothetical protein EBBID32_17700 [Sphingobium indicum BiD32]